MEIDLRDAPAILFDRDLWRRFCDRFSNEETALAAISRPPYGRYGYHGDNPDDVPAPPNEKVDHAEVTFRLGNELIGWLKQSLIAGSLTSAGVVFHLVYQRGEDEPVDIPGEQWKGLWPEFKDNRAFGNGRYEHVRIFWDARKASETKALEDIIFRWLQKDCPDARLRKKEQLRSEAHDRFGDVPVRVFNRAYSRAFKRERGAPRRSNNRR